jgi:hypothetical protein
LYERLSSHLMSVHPGLDCYAMTRDVVKSVTLGDLYVGHTPGGGHESSNVRVLYEYIMTTSYKTFAASIVQLDVSRWRRSELEAFGRSCESS